MPVRVRQCRPETGGGDFLRSGAVMTEYAAVDAMLQELERARVKHPQWPTDIVHQVAIMVEEAGESLRAALNHAYEGGSFEEVRREVIQSGAMAIRVLINLEKGQK